jgi:hypothetical protein
MLFSKTRLQSEEIVSELVHSFLLPEVQKITVREKGTVLLISFVFETTSVFQDL